MPKITIDGRELTFEGRKMILQVAIDHGLAIPHYCYHAGLSIVASCRICLAEVAQPNPKTGKVELIPKLMPTCQTPAAEGMVVYTRSPKSIANQKAVMEYLLINHPLDCPVCDQAGECYLQDYSYRYGRAESRFQEDKIKQPVKDIGPHVKLYSDRCILCSRCVRFTREVTGTGELAVFGRGNREQIDVYPGRPLENELSGNVVDICPVGALLDKDFLFTQRVWFLTATPGIDGLTASGDNLRIEHNDGRIYRLKPRTNLDVNKWWISDEIRYGWKFIHSPERLTTPRRQQYGTQAECDWTRAAEDVRDLFRAAVKEKGPGPGALAALISPMLTCEEAYLLGKFVRGLDAEAVLGIGPIPVIGTDKTFPGGYTIYAEKCPNSRGVRRALELLNAGAEKVPGTFSQSEARVPGTLPASGGTSGGAVLSYEDFLKKVGDKAAKTAGVLVAGGYPGAGAWTTKELTTALAKKALVVLDILPNDLTAKADVLLPLATWVQTAGTFENACGRLQSFARAIPARQGARPAGQAALDFMAACSLRPRQVYDAERVRAEMGGVFVSEIKSPEATRPREADMAYVEL